MKRKGVYNGYVYPLYRHHITNKYYVLLLVEQNKAEVGIVENPDSVNDFVLWSGFKTVKTIISSTPRKALREAREWINSQPDKDEVKEDEKLRNIRMRGQV
jgi:hypothetical protein